MLALCDADWQLGMAHDLLHVVRRVRLVTPQLRAAGGGAIANVSSFAAVEPDTAFPTSAVSRAALTVCAELFADACAAPTACA